MENADARLSHAQGCLPLLVDSTTEHQKQHSTSLWLAFLTSVQQGRALEHALIEVISTSTHCHAYWKYTGSLQNTNASIFWTLCGDPKVSALDVCVVVTTYVLVSICCCHHLSTYPADMSIAGCSKYPLTEEDMTTCSLTARMLMYNPWHNEKEVYVIRRRKQPPPSPA